MNHYFRKMSESDIGELDRIQKAAYPPQYWESGTAFLSKFRAYPEGCWLGLDGGVPIAYLLSYPGILGFFPALNSLDSAPDEPFDCYYIHDLAVMPKYRGQRIARTLLDKAFDAAHLLGLQAIALVAVNNAVPFWERMGFVCAPLPLHEVARLQSSYGADANYMIARHAEPSRVLSSGDS